MKIIPNIIKTKRHLCASGSILLSLAQKWSLVGVAVCGLSLLGAGNVSAASITLTTPQSLVINVTPTAEGKFAKSNAESISVTSDAYAGYTLKISGNDNNALKGENGELPSITAADGIAENVFNTAAYNNMWGYKPSKFNGSDNSKFFPGPKSSGDIIDKTTDAGVNMNNYTIEFGVRVNNEQAAGAYKSTFVISVTANDLAYSITYDKNAEAASSAPTKQSGHAQEGTSIIIGDAPTRPDYYFVGWCTTKSTDETCDGEVYQPKEEYTLVNGENVLNLYAMWTQKTMQNWNECDTLGNKTIYLPDVRDGKVYKVRKLSDDKCWMTQNLAIGSNSERTVLTAKDTDLDPGKTIAGEKEQGTFTLPKGTDAAGTSDDTSENGGWNYEQFNTKRLYISTDISAKYGGYYNWYTVTAGEGTEDIKSGDVEHSICPKGWRLPTKDEIALLVSDTNNKTLGDFTVFAGRCDQSGCPTPNGRGVWWSSTAYDSNSAYHANAISSDFYYDKNRKGYGRSARCIARE